MHLGSAHFRPVWAALVLFLVIPLSHSVAAIIGGVEVKQGDPIAASTVAVYQSGELCTGSLIADQIVITAAHCIPKSGLPWVSFGLETNKYVGIQRRASDYEIHPDYIPLRKIKKKRRRCERECDGDLTCRKKCHRYVNGYDLALLYLKEPAPQGYQPAVIEWDRLALLGQPSLVVAGFGRTSPQGHDSKIFHLKKTSLKLLIPGPEIVLQQDRKNAVCKGDSGGPAFLKRGSELYLVGVASRGDFECRKTQIYSMLSLHRDWVEGAINRLMNRAGASR